MTIDTVLLKASYDLMPEEDAISYTVRKLADDVAKGRSLTTLKLTRFIDGDDGSGMYAGYDHLKFNFPICGNLSTADLMLIYCAMNGFDVFVVGNAERGRRDALIAETLNLSKVHSIPELDFPASADPEKAARQLKFVNTQRRGYAAIPHNSLVLEMAADQPLLYNTYRHALDLSVDASLAINLNAVTLMKQAVPSFVRNGYDKVVNSQGQEVVIKENNNFAQDKLSARLNEPVFGTIYAGRNGGKYLGFSELASRLRPAGLLRRLFGVCKMMHRMPELVSYLKQRKTLGKAVSYGTLQSFMNAMLSPYWLKKGAHVDATNDDIFACWDVDGLNNDFLTYRTIFDRNFGNLAKIMPYAKEVYRVHEAIGKRGDSLGITTRDSFRHTYEKMCFKILGKLSPASLESMHVDEETIETLCATGTAILTNGHSHNRLFDDIERYASTTYLQGFERSREEYRRIH
jgi:hypothetical protein